MSTEIRVPSKPASAKQLPIVDLGKALASQLIVWHHITLYSPMRQVVDPLASGLFSWLADPARMAVQLFLVMAGFLAARSLMPTPGAALRIPPADLPGKFWQRYLRLGPTYLAAIALALASAALARSLSDDPTIPEAPSALQLWANVLMLQDLVGQEALSAGLWYVAIDLQLYGLLLLVLAARAGVRRHRLWLIWLSVLMVTALTAASLFWFNRQGSLDVWGIYFVGSYGLGMLAAWVANSRQRWLGATALALLVGLALLVEWRDRIAVAGVIACLLALNLDKSRWLAFSRSALVAWLAKVSYSVFLAHYAVCLVVGALFSALWPDSVIANLLGLLLAWGLSLAAGWALHVGVELHIDAVRGASRLRSLWASAIG